MEAQNSLVISVIGLGYIGLPTAAMFASRKVPVVGVDVNPATVATINDGRIHIVEPDLDMIVHAAVEQGYLRAVTAPEPADAFLIAVPTPLAGTDRHPDTHFVERAARSIAPVLKSGDLVVLESTSPVGTTEAMASWLAAERPDLSFPQSHGEDSDIRIAYCPERVLPGKIIQELVANDRLIGGLTRRCSDAAVELYRSFVTGECIVTDARTAELAKLTENSFRDVNIAFANELSLVCDRLGIDVWELIELANRHPRVSILQPGPGVGGHCIAVDPWFVVAGAPEQTRLIRAARQVNDSKPDWVLDKVRNAVEAVAAKRADAGAGDVALACYGLAFKADIDDLRESPSVEILEALCSTHEGPLMAVEPNISELPESLRRARLVDLETARSEADIHLLLVDHREFRGTPRPIGEVVDTRGVWR